jgi:hypothetical protein
LSELPDVSMHELPHKDSEPAHPVAHLPCEHTMPVAHAVAQEPQFFGSEVVSTHAPEHVVCPVRQPHTLA